MTQAAGRGTWNSNKDFILALVSYGVGLGNVWRFPYLAYSSGGGAFLIPFILSSIFVGIPYAVLEVSLGQWMKEGGIGAWNLVPLFKGIGFANLLLIFLANVYYEVILAWTLRYLWDSFNTVLPWGHCDNAWNTACCKGSGNNNNNNINNNNVTLTTSSFSNQTINLINNNLNNNNNTMICGKRVDPITEYWERNILGISAGIEQIGSIKPDIFFTLALSWLMVYFCIFRGMKNSQVIVYITATLPYVFLFTLLIRGMFLPGAWDGIIYYLKPDWSKLQNFQVWSDAGTQVFYSYGIAVSAMVALGSYNKFHHNSYRDVVFFSISNTLTSVLSGFVVFSVLGFMAHNQGVDISMVAEEGPGLAFIVYPQALALMPFSPLWSILFFVMLLLLGLGTQIVAAEAITTAIIDEYMPRISSRFCNLKYTKELFSLFNVLISFVCGIPMTTNGGMYIFQIFDYYAASRTLLFVGLAEVVAIAYFYGIDRYLKNLELMWKFKLSPFLKIMWTVVTPLATLVLIVFTVMSYEDLTYNRTYKYPDWALRFGWGLSISSVICIPFYAIFKFAFTSGSFQERCFKVRLTRLKAHQLGVDATSSPAPCCPVDDEEEENDFDESKSADDSSAENKSFLLSRQTAEQQEEQHQQSVVTVVNTNNEKTAVIQHPTVMLTAENIPSQKQQQKNTYATIISDEENLSELANSRTIFKP